MIEHRRVLMWFRHVERKKEELLVEKINVLDVRCEVERKTINGMDGLCKEHVISKRDVCIARKMVMRGRDEWKAV